MTKGEVVAWAFVGLVVVAFCCLAAVIIVGTVRNLRPKPTNVRPLRKDR